MAGADVVGSGSVGTGSSGGWYESSEAYDSADPYDSSGGAVTPITIIAGSSIAGAGSVNTPLTSTVGTASVSGAGATSAAGNTTSGSTGAASISGAGNTSAVIYQSATATASGAGSTSASALVITSGVASASGAGSASSLARINAGSSATGVGAVTADGITPSAVSVLATADLSAAATVDKNGTVSFDATASLTSTVGSVLATTAALTASAGLVTDQNLFEVSRSVLANFSSEGVPDFSDPSGTGYPEGTFDTTVRIFSDLLDVTDYSQSSLYYRDPYGGLNGELQIYHPVGPGPNCSATVSSSRMVVGWVQSNYWFGSGGPVEARFYVALVDTSNPRMPRLVDRIYHSIQGSDSTYIPYPTGSGCNALYLPDGDVVLSMTLYSGSGETTNDTGYGDGTPMARVHVDGDSLSFKWCHMVGHPTLTSSYYFYMAPTFDWDSGDIFVMSSISLGGSSSRKNWTAKLNVDTGLWRPGSYVLTATTNTQCATDMMAFKTGNYFFLDDDQYQRGSIGTGSLTTGWNAVGGDWYASVVDYAYDGSHYPIYDPDTDTYLKIFRTTSPAGSLMRVVRLADIDGVLTATETYSTFELLAANPGLTNKYKGQYYPMKKWSGDNNFLFPLSNPDGTVTFVGQGYAYDFNTPEQHQGGVQVSYKISADDPNDSLHTGESRRWDTPPAAGNWLDYLYYSGDYYYGFNPNWYMSACLLNSGRVGISLYSGQWTGRNQEPHVSGRQFVTIYDPGEAPPLKLTQRDDGKTDGGIKIGYQPDNGSAIRAGRVAW